mmetsp:Transcript_2794/g.6052  ORF Transcript_2794/g.6052 Transcript_2794/m.6052 type:complete len:128 (-) Transcript_2794:57-440(-)
MSEYIFVLLLNVVTAEGQTRANNDYGRDHQSLATGKRGDNKPAEQNWGAFHLLPNIATIRICCGKEQASEEWKRFDNALKAQREARCKKEEIALKKRLDAMQEEYIVAIYFHEQYNSQCVEDYRGSI